MTFECERYRVCTASVKAFHHESLQQAGTIIQQAHRASSVRDRSRSSHLKLSKQPMTLNKGTSTSNVTDSVVPVTPTIPIVCKKLKRRRPQLQRNRISTKRALNKDDACPFHFVLFVHKDDNAWYLSCIRENTTNIPHSNPRCHLHHLPNCHQYTDKNALSNEAHELINQMLLNNSSFSEIKSVLNILHGISIRDSTLYSIQLENLSLLVDGTAEELQRNPSLLGPAQKLITLFKNMPSVNFMYVTHKIDSGFVTYHRGRTKSNDASEVGVDDESIYNWRKQLQISNHEILVSFAYCTDVEKK